MDTLDHLECRTAPGAPCPTFARHLSDLIDGACSPELALWLRRHALMCSACGQALELARALRALMRSWAAAEPPPPPDAPKPPVLRLESR